MITIYSTGQVARVLDIPPYRISYAHSSGQLAEPAFRFIDKRCYTEDDVQRVAEYFGITLTSLALKAVSKEAK